MQFSTLSVALFAALASANAHHPQHLHLRRQYNGTLSGSVTSSAGGGITTPPVPLGTGSSSPAATSSPSGEESVVLTYTLGTGTSTTVVTTTIKHTSTATVYATLPGSSGEAADVTGKDAAVNTESTTTFTGTSTSTKYVTVVPASEGSALESGSGSCAPVTVTVALSTVTVTETGTPTPASGPEGAITSLPVDSYSTAALSATDSPAVAISTQTVQPLPVTTAAPYGNGTDSGAGGIASSGRPSVFPSGFISKTKRSAAPSPYY